MKRTIPFIAAACLGGIAVFGWAMFGWLTSDDGARAVSATSVEVAQRTELPVEEDGLGHLERVLEVQSGSTRKVGEFELSGHRTLRLHTVDIDGGKSCLIDEGPDIGAGATCLENGLFEQRRVAFFVGSQGGPERFSELHLAGIAAPGIRLVSLVKSDGSRVDRAVNGDRAFLFESPRAELQHDVLPAALLLFGADRRLVEVVTIPALR